MRAQQTNDSVQVYAPTSNAEKAEVEWFYKDLQCCIQYASKFGKLSSGHRTGKGPLDCKEIQPVHPDGDKSWVFIGSTDAEAETPILWPPHEKS